MWGVGFGLRDMTQGAGSVWRMVKGARCEV
jgi:hypothetical protein